MAYKNVQTGLDASRVALVHSLIDQLLVQLAFMIKLSPKERSRLHTVGKRRYSFVVKALRFARRFFKLLPGHRPIADFARIASDFDELTDILQRVESLRESLYDTQLQVGANYYDFSLTFYNVVKNDTDDQPGTDTVKAELAEHFERKNGEDVFIEDPEEETNDEKSNDKVGGPGKPIPSTEEGGTPA